MAAITGAAVILCWRTCLIYSGMSRTRVKSFKRRGPEQIISVCLSFFEEEKEGNADDFLLQSHSQSCEGESCTVD